MVGVGVGDMLGDMLGDVSGVGLGRELELGSGSPTSGWVSVGPAPTPVGSAADGRNVSAAKMTPTAIRAASQPLAAWSERRTHLSGTDR